ncbi:MAG: dimethylsulfonioproprionate lyase family protein [Tabrizicola sp.]
MTDVLDHLHAPLCVKGSGRVRYGAAMALWREGLISAEVLEVYRVAAAHDARDPLAELASRGLPLPPASVGQSPVRTLYLAAREYVLSLDHPGAAEVTAGLPADPGSERVVNARPNAVLSTWLTVALAQLSATHPALASAIAAAAPQLEWVTYDSYPRTLIGDAFPNGHAFASIFGGDAPFAGEDFELGVFLIAPGVLYRDHHHAAPELYAPLTGPHGWRFGTGRPLTIKPAHQPVWNPAHQPHLTRVGAVPFLCFFVWTQDVNEIAQVIPADDWAALEEAEIA